MENPIEQRKRLVQSRIEKSFDSGLSISEEIEKARVGYYADNAQNRKLMRVGNKYGSTKNTFKPGQQEMHHAVNEMRSADVTEFLDSIFKRKDAIINKLKERFIEELVSPLQEKIDDIIKNKSKREQELQSYQQKLDDLLKVKASIDEQLQTIENIKE